MTIKVNMSSFVRPKSEGNKSLLSRTYQTRRAVFHLIGKRVEHSTRGGVFLMNFKVLGDLFDIASQSKLRGNGEEN